MFLKKDTFSMFTCCDKKTQFMQMQRNSCYLCTKQIYIFSKSDCCSMAIRAPCGASNSITSVKFNQLVGFNHNSIRIFWELDKLIKGSIDQFTFKAVKRCNKKWWELQLDRANSQTMQKWVVFPLKGGKIDLVLQQPISLRYMYNF